MVTRSVLVAPGVLLALEDALHENGIEGKRCTLYGERTYAATAGDHPPFQRPSRRRKSRGTHACRATRRYQGADRRRQRHDP